MFGGAPSPPPPPANRARHVSFFFVKGNRSWFPGRRWRLDQYSPSFFTPPNHQGDGFSHHSYKVHTCSLAHKHTHTHSISHTNIHTISYTYTFEHTCTPQLPPQSLRVDGFNQSMCLFLSPLFFSLWSRGDRLPIRLENMVACVSLTRSYIVCIHV